MKVEIQYPKAKCSYCGKEYTKTHNRQMYCSDECRKHSRQEKRRIYDSKYYYKNRHKRNRTLIGTRSIGPHKHPDDDREAEIVQNEIRRHQLHIF